MKTVLLLAVAAVCTGNIEPDWVAPTDQLSSRRLRQAGVHYDEEQDAQAERDGRIGEFSSAVVTSLVKGARMGRKGYQQRARDDHDAALSTASKPCPACTFANSPLLKACEMCSTPL